MSKEVKAQETEKAKSNKKYVALAIVVILAAIGIMMNSGFKENTTVTTIATTEETTSTIEEPVTARIDITTPLVNADQPQFEVYVDGTDKPLKQEKWMSKYDIQGSVAQKDGGSIDILVKVLNDSDISISLSGIWDKNANGKLIEHWVKYTVFTINDVEILSEPTEVWVNKPFTHTINAETNDEYKVHIEWSKADK